jgi:hypothetical protein
MKSERLWMLILALTSFCAGLAAGVLIGLVRQPAGEPGPFAAYEARMREVFDLDAERSRHLRYILDRYADKIESLKERNIAALEDELINEGQTHRDLIRKWVVPAERRQEFDLWVEGLPAVQESEPH